MSSISVPPGHQPAGVGAPACDSFPGGWGCHWSKVLQEVRKAWTSGWKCSARPRLSARGEGSRVSAGELALVCHKRTPQDSDVEHKSITAVVAARARKAPGAG